MVEILKQPQYRPIPVEREVVRVWVGTGGHLDAYPVADAVRFVEGFVEFLETRYAAVLETIRTSGDLSDDTETELRTALDAFRETFAPTSDEAAGSEAGRGEGTPRDEVKPDVGWDRMSSAGDTEPQGEPAASTEASDPAESTEASGASSADAAAPE